MLVQVSQKADTTMGLDMQEVSWRREQEWTEKTCRLRCRSNPVEQRREEGGQGGKRLRMQHSSKKGLAVQVESS